MTEEGPEFDQLMQRARTGCPEAAQELFARYGSHVRRVVRRVLHRRLRRCYDSADFAQSVWASFFLTPADQYSFPNARALIAFLSRMACHKVMETTRRKLGSLRSDMKRDEPLDAPHPEQGGAVVEGIAGPSPTPSEYAMADERWEILVQGLSPGHRRVLELLREGHTQADIVRVLGVHRKVIQRLLDRLARHREAP